MIREFAYYGYIFPAILRGQPQVSIGVWEFYQRTGIKERDFPALISALSQSFMKQKYQVKAIRSRPGRTW